ncbi:MAG: hypothetical protein JXA96_17130 [Sedimentisphaerales bacterium]|nr:hypothetical protein [Sedimentisphaerales bacterium]
MAKLINGRLKIIGLIAQWVIVTLAIGAVIFNTGVTYNHVQHNAQSIQEMKQQCALMQQKIDSILFKLAEK